MPATVSHVLSVTNADNPLYAIKPSNWNSAHLMTLNAVGSEISNAFGSGGGVTFGYDGTNVTAAAGTATPSPVNFSAGTTSNNLGSVVFADSNGVSFGLNGSTVTATVATNYLTSQSNQNVTAANGGFAFQTLSFSNANNFTFATSAGSAIVGSYTVPTVTNSSWTVSDSATSATVGRLAFTASNGITMTLSTSNNGNHTLFASYTVPTVTNSSWTVSDAATSGTVARLAFTNLNGVTLSLSSGAGGSHTIVGSHNALTSQSNQAVSNSAGSFTFQTLNFSNANNVTWGTSAGGIVTASVAAGAGGVAAGVSNTGNTLGNTGTASAGTIIFAGSGAITASQSTAAGQSTIWYSVAAQSVQTQPVSLFATSNTTNSTSATAAANSFLFQGVGGVSVGASNGSVQISAPATSSLVGTSGLSVSTAGSTISVLPIALSAYDPYPILTGSAVSSHAPASFWFSRMILDWDVAVSYANVLKSLNVSAPGVSSQNSSLTNKFSYSHGLSIFTRNGFGANSSQMSQWTTASFGMTGSLSQSSSSASVALSWVTNSTGGTTSFSTTSASNNWSNFFTGMQMFRIPLVTTLTPGEYFIGQAHSSTTATVGSNFTLLSVSNFHVAPQAISFATITSSGSLGASSPDGLGIGVASAVTTNNTMAISVISAGTQQWWYMNFSNA